MSIERISDHSPTLYRIFDVDDLPEPLKVHTGSDGTLTRLNDPERFAMTPHVLAMDSVSVKVSIADRSYTVVGMTRTGDLVVDRTGDRA